MTRGLEKEGRGCSVTDALLTFLPVGISETLAVSLTASDVETLQYLYRKSVPDNTLRAIATDLAYLEAWHLEATGQHLSWPADQALLLKFIAHHLFDAAARKATQDHGMLVSMEERLRARGALATALPHAPSTVKRRFSHWKRLHEVRGLDHMFDDKTVRLALRAAVTASTRLKARKSALPVTMDILERVVETCDPYRYADRRDRALLLMAFGTGGRRRSEMCNLQIEDIKSGQGGYRKGGPTPPHQGPPVYEIALRRAKRITAQDGERIHVTGRPARALEDWLACMNAERQLRFERQGKTPPDAPLMGPLFRKIDRWGNIVERALSPGSVNLILKRRLEQAGLEPGHYSAHGLRSGFMTEARNRGIPLEQAMRQSKHRSYQVASQYYQDIDDATSEAINLLG